GSILLYIVLTGFVATGRTLPLDTSLMLRLALERREWLSPIVQAIGSIGGGAIAIPAALGFIGLLWRRRRKSDARAYGIIAVGGWGVYALAKVVVRRGRPHVISYLYHGAGWYSYPSGHSTLAPIVFGLAAVFWSAAWTSNGRRRMLVGAAGLLAVAIACSRVYIGVHYPSDALGGLLLGTAWSAFWYWWWGTSVVESR
ncbi:MAG: phosphatase PAP2 family protein, partial [Gemmatimonadales bacterium]